MSAEDLPEAVYSENVDEDSSHILTGIILIPQEDDEVGSEPQVAETENKYVMHEVIIEIMPFDDVNDMKPDIKMLDEDPAPDILPEEVDDVNAMDVSTNEIDVSTNEGDVSINEVDVSTNEVDVSTNEIHITTNEINVLINSELKDINKADTTILDKAIQEKSTNEIDVSNNNTDPQDIHIADTTKVNKAIQENGPLEQTDTVHDLRQTRTSIEERVILPIGQRANIKLFTEDTGPQMYKAKGALVTAPIVTKNLPKVFDYLPIHGKPQDNNNLNEYFSNKIREFVGCGLTDHEFQQLEEYCSPEQLKTGNEMVMETTVPVMGVISKKIIEENLDSPEDSEAPDLCILKKNKLRMEKDSKGLFTKKLKYRGVRSLPFTQVVYQLPPLNPLPTKDNPDVDLEPGRDILYRVRVYRPYIYSQSKFRFTRTRHSVFCYDIMLTGRNKLSDLRDRFVCHNDFDMRVDVSNNPDLLPNAKAKEVFPSGFLFINNVFYVDTREGCVDYSEPIREWARKKDIGDFPKKDMCAVRLEDLTLKLGYPEVYVHQGNCEHVFLFSEIRLLNPTDPLRLHNYPCSTAVAQNQTVYCTTCAEFSAKWIVVGCNRVPFDPAFFCDTCFRQYLYIDGQKIGDFKAYSYRGNALNVLKPQ